MLEPRFVRLIGNSLRREGLDEFQPRPVSPRRLPRLEFLNPSGVPQSLESEGFSYSHGRLLIHIPYTHTDGRVLL